MKPKVKSTIYIGSIALIAWTALGQVAPAPCCASHTCGDVTVTDCLGRPCPVGTDCSATASGCSPAPFVVAGCVATGGGGGGQN